MVNRLAALAMFGVFLLMSCSTTREKSTLESKQYIGIQKISHESVANLIKSWPIASNAAANDMMGKYGLPNRATSTELIWKKAPPYKEIHVYKDELIHNFPSPHTDVLEQSIAYKVPTSMASNLLSFNGSFIIDRTKGELRFRSEKEATNILAFNLADKMIRNKISVKEARAEYARHTIASMLGEDSPLTTKLSFMQSSETADPDMAVEFRTPELQKLQQAQEYDEVFKNSLPLQDK